MPAYRLALAVGVGCEIYFARLSRLGGEPFNNFFFARGDFVLRFEVRADPHAQRLLGQIPYVSARSVDLVLAV